MRAKEQMLEVIKNAMCCDIEDFYEPYKMCAFCRRTNYDGQPTIRCGEHIIHDDNCAGIELTRLVDGIKEPL